MPCPRLVVLLICTLVFCLVLPGFGIVQGDVDETSGAGDILHWKAVALEAHRESIIIESIAALAAIDDDDARDAIGVVLNERARSGEFIPAYRIIEASREAEISDGSDLWRTLEWIRNTGGHWRDRVVAAELLAIHGDQSSIDFLVTAYDEPRVLLPIERVKLHVGEALAKVDDPVAGALLAEHAVVCDPNHLLNRLGIMLEYDNRQSVRLARSVLRRQDNHELDLVTRLIMVFERYGDKDDLPLLRPLMSDTFLSGFAEGEDRDRLATSLSELISALESQE